MCASYLRNSFSCVKIMIIYFQLSIINKVILCRMSEEVSHVMSSNESMMVTNEHPSKCNDDRNGNNGKNETVTSSISKTGNTTTKSKSKYNNFVFDSTWIHHFVIIILFSSAWIVWRFSNRQTQSVFRQMSWRKHSNSKIKWRWGKTLKWLWNWIVHTLQTYLEISSEYNHKCFAIYKFFRNILEQI